MMPSLSLRSGAGWTLHATALGNNRVDLGLLAAYAHRPLVIRGEGEERAVIGPQFTTTLLGAGGIGDRIELGVALPLTIFQGGEIDSFFECANVRAPGGVGLGDLRAMGKLTIVDTGSALDPSGFALGLAIDIWFPTGNAENFRGGDFRAAARLLATGTFGRHRLSLNVGYTVRPRAEQLGLVVDDTVDAGLALDLRLSEGFSAVLESHASLSFLSDTLGIEELPAEASLAGRLHFGELAFELGGSFGITRGFGTPTFRTFLRGIYQTRPEPPLRDFDYDGIFNDDDQCPLDPEDYNGIEDRDGCPDAVEEDADEARENETSPADDATVPEEEVPSSISPAEWWLVS